MASLFDTIVAENIGGINEDSIKPYFEGTSGQRFYYWEPEFNPIFLTRSNPQPLTSSILATKDSISTQQEFIDSFEARFPSHTVTFYENLNVIQVDDLTYDELELLFVPQLPTYTFVELNNVATTSKVSDSWALGRITTLGSPTSSPWDVNPPNLGNGVTCCVVDSGLNTSHPDVSGKATNGYSFISGQAWNEDPLGHGTAVTSMVCGTTSGIADDVTIIPYKVFGSEGETSTSTILAALNALITNEAPLGGKVINCSFGGSRDFTLDLAMETLSTGGATVVVAAGNDNGNAVNYSPAASPDVITVGATTITDGKASFSNFGDSVDLWAPGESVKAATGNSGFSNVSGTSFSSPLVAGAACILLNDQPTLSSVQVAQALRNASQQGQFTSDVNNYLAYCGEDFINRAISEPIEPPIDPPVDPLPPPIDDDVVTPPDTGNEMDSEESENDQIVYAAIVLSVVVGVLILIYFIMNLMM